MSISWNKNLETGISVIDEQHKTLFESIGKLDSCKDSKSEFYELLINLQSYISVHFSTEEDYMRYSDYPDFVSHKSCHDKFVEDYKNIIKKVSKVDSILDLSQELIIFVETWIKEHYNNEDVKMASFLNKSNLENKQND